MTYTPRAWDPRSLQSRLNGPLYFYLLGRFASTIDYFRNNNYYLGLIIGMHIFSSKFFIYFLVYVHQFYLFNL